jgi:hypothetical protein
VRLKTASFVPFLALLAVACSSVDHADRSKMKPLRLSDLGRHPDAFADAVTENGSGVLLLLKKGESLPVLLTADLKFAKIISGRNRFVFEQDVFVYMSTGEIQLSPDREHWAAIGDMDAMKKVFGIEGGQLSLGFGVSGSHGPQGTIKLKTH